MIAIKFLVLLKYFIQFKTFSVTCITHKIIITYFEIYKRKNVELLTGNIHKHRIPLLAVHRYLANSPL